MAPLPQLSEGSPSSIGMTTNGPRRFVYVSEHNAFINSLESQGLALTTLTLSGDLTVNGTTTLNGNLVLGDAAADSLTINATTTFEEDVNYSNQTGITAHAGGGQASAVALTKEINLITVCATAGDSVKLKAATAGAHQRVKNVGATALDIFPATGDSIDALAVNLAIRIQPGSTVDFYAKDTTVWESNVDASFTLSAPTTLKGQLELKAADSAGNTVTTITNASQAGARTYSVPDAGGNAEFVMNAGAQNIAGAKTFTDPITQNDTTNQIVLGVTNTTTINSVAPSASRVHTIPDPGANANFLMSEGLNAYSMATGITAAAAGGGQAGATLLAAEFNYITTVTAPGDCVKLPVGTLGATSGNRVVVRNGSTNTVAVFPNTGDVIDGLAPDASISIPGKATKVFYATLSAGKTYWKEDSFVISADEGSVGAPSYTFNGRSAQGMYSVSSTQIGFNPSGGLTTVVDTSGLSSDSLRARVPLVTAGAGTVSVVEYGDGRDMTTVLTLTDFVVGALAGAAAALGIGNIVAAFPAGQHLELVYSLASLNLKCAGTAVATDTGLGSVVASGAINILSGTATFEDRLTGQTITTDPAGGAAVSALTAATAGVATGISLNTSGAVKNVFLNSAGTWNANNTGNLTASGTIVLKWTKMQ